MVRSELIEHLVEELERSLPGVGRRDLEDAVAMLQDELTEALAHGRRIEVRGFGSFTLHWRRPKLARNPKTGAPVPLGERYVVHFKPGKDLRERANSRAGAAGGAQE